MTDSSDPSARVLFLCRVLWNGGVQRVAIAEVEGLRRLGQPADLMFLRRVEDVAYSLPAGALFWDGPPTPAAVAAFERVITRWFAPHRGEEATVDLFRLWASRKRLSEYAAVVYNDQYAGLIGIWNRLTRRQPYVQLLHEFYPRVPRGVLARLTAPFAELLDVVSILMAPSIVTISTAVKDRLDRVVPGRTQLARNGVTVDNPPIVPSAENRRRVFSITVWDRGRRPEAYVEIARRLPEFSFTMAGIWADPAHLKEFRSLASGVSNLTITGSISEEERRRLQREALFYLRLGFNESGPGVGGLEALGSGAILICNRGLGISEIITDGVNGFVLATPDPAEAASLLRSLDAQTLPELTRIAKAGGQLATTYSWEAHCRTVLRALGLPQPPVSEPRHPGSSAPTAAQGRG